VTSCLGEALTYNKAAPAQADGIVACAAEVVEEVLARIVPLYASRVQNA
jgi:hypothetical protein